MYSVYSGSVTKYGDVYVASPLYQERPMYSVMRFSCTSERLSLSSMTPMGR